MAFGQQNFENPITAIRASATGASQMNFPTGQQAATTGALGQVPPVAQQGPPPQQQAAQGTPITINIQSPPQPGAAQQGGLNAPGPGDDIDIGPNEPPEPPPDPEPGPGPGPGPSPGGQPPTGGTGGGTRDGTEGDGQSRVDQLLQGLLERFDPQSDVTAPGEAAVALAMFRDLINAAGGNYDQLLAQIGPTRMMNRLRGVLGRGDLAPGSMDTGAVPIGNGLSLPFGPGARESMAGLSEQGNNNFNRLSESEQNGVREIMGGGGGGPLASNNVQSNVRRILAGIIETGPEVDFENLVGEFKNARERFIPVREAGRRRLLADAVSRGFDPNDTVVLAALAELDAKVETSLTQEYRTLASEEMQRTSERFMQALSIGANLEIADQQYALGLAELQVSRAALRLQERLGMGQLDIQRGRLALDANIAENQIMLQNIAQSQQWQMFMESNNLAWAEFEFAQQQAADGNVALLIAMMIDFFESAQGGFTEE